MKIKNIVTALLVAILLASCTPKTPSVPTITSIVSSPVSSPAPTSTITVPSPTPKPATETPVPKPTIEIKDYEPQTVTVSGKINFEESTDVSVLVKEGFYIRKWSKFTLPNGEVIALVDISENLTVGKIFLAYSMTGSSSRQGIKAETAFLSEFWNKGIALTPLLQGENNITAFTGNKPEEFLLFNNAFDGILEGKLGNQMIAFALSGGTDTSLLPRYPGIPLPVFFTYRVDFGTK